MLFAKKLGYFALICTWSLTSFGANSPKKWIDSISVATANLAPSQYSVSAITGSSLIIETESSLGFPLAKLYTFKLCLIHPTDKTPFKGVTATIEGSSVPLKPQILDDSCISWTENINYHFTAPARYVTQLRTLTINKSPIPETIAFQFAINPWLHGENSGAAEIADFIKIKPRNPVPASKAFSALMGKNGEPLDVPIIANDARINFQELGIDSKLGGRFLFDFRITPQMEVYNTSNQPVYLKLNQGDFEFEAYLLSTLFEGENQVRRVVNPTPLKGAAHLRDGALAFLQEITLPAIPSRGRLELAVTLKPVQSASYLRVFKGIYILGDYTDLKENLFARLKTGYTNANKDFNFENYVGLNKKEESPFYSTANTQDGMRKLKYEFEPLMFKLTRVGDETATTRQIYYQVKACVHNGTDNTPLRGYHFKITKGTPDSSASTELNPSVRPSEYDSCIYWDDRIDHKYYAPQKYYKTEYRLQNSDLNLDETLVAYINPWDIVLSRDGRTIEPQEIEQENNSNKVSAQIYLPTYKIQTRTINYNVDKSLNLQINKQVHLLIEPNVLNYSHLTKGIDSRDSIRDGVWKIRWAILHNRYETKQNQFNILSKGEFLTVATQGRIIAPLNLQFKDFRFIDSRNYFMIEIAPVKQELVQADEKVGFRPKDGADLNSIIDLDSGLPAQTFVGPLLAGSDEEIGYLVPHPNNQAIAAFLPSSEKAKAMTSEAALFEKDMPSWDQVSQLPEIQSKQSSETLKEWLEKIYVTNNNMRSWNLDEPTDRIALRRAMGPSPETLHNFSMAYQRDLFMPDMLIRALKRHELTAELEDRLCFYFFDRNPQIKVAFKSSLLPWMSSDHWLKQCLRSAGKKDHSFFNAQIETPVESITDIQFIGSTSSSLSIGSGFSISSSESSSVSSQVSASTQIGVSLKLTELISIGGSTSYSLSKTDSVGQGSSNSLSLSTGVSLNVRNISLLLSGTFSQQCLTAELNPSLYMTEQPALLKDTQKALRALGPTARFLTQKVRLCITDEPNQSFRSHENYYFITQDTTGSGFIDSPDLRNRPLLLELRGRAAYNNFVKYTAARFALPQQTNTIDDQNLELNDRAQKSLQLAVPAFPGLLIEQVRQD